jgi:hypothetical protein
MTIYDNSTSDESRHAAIGEVARIYHYFRENSRGQMIDQEIEVEGPICTWVTPDGGHEIETVNGFGLTMPPGWSFFESHPKDGHSPFGLDVGDDQIAAASLT